MGRLHVSGVAPWLCVFTCLLVVTACGGGTPLPVPEPDPIPLKGRVVFGPLDGALVQIYRVVGDGTFDLLDTQVSRGGTDTAEVGMFNATPVTMAPDELYLFKASGGDIVDFDHDGLIDAVPTPNEGAVHALVTGAQAAAGRVNINVLTEILYQRVYYMLASRYTPAKISVSLDKLADLLLAHDLDGGAGVDAGDTLRWDPATDLGALRKDIHHFDNLHEALAGGKEGWAAWESRSLADCSTAIQFLDDHVQDVFVVGTMAYVAIEGTGFAIVDISDPRQPQVKSIVDGLGEGEDIAVQGSFLYYAHRDDGRVEIFDVSVPTAPVARGSLMMAEPDCMHPDGGLLFVCDRTTRRVHILDITDPDAPFEVSSIATMDDPNQVVRVGDYLYVADSDYLTVIDISVLSAPFVRTSIEGWDGDIDGLQVADGYAYCADGSAGLLVVDLTNLNNIQIVANVPSRSECDRIWLDGQRLYMSAREAGVQVIDITTPTAPSHQGYIGVTPRVRVIAVEGPVACVACDEGGLRLLDLTQPDALLFTDLAADLVLGSVETGTGNLDVVASGNYAYLAKDDGLSIVDIGDPTSPTLAWSGTFAAGDAEALAIQGNLVYVAAEGGGLQIVDVTDPLNPDVKSPFPLSDEAQDVAVMGGHAYVADRFGAGFVVVDVTDPDAPLRVGDVLAPGGQEARGVAVQGAWAYCAWSDTGLLAINISDPSAPTIVGQLVLHDVGSASPSRAKKVAVSGSYAYVMADELHIVDISDPTNLTLETTYEIDIWDDDVSLSGDFAMVVGSTAGILVLNVSDPSDPWEVMHLPVLGDARAAYAHNGLLLIANQEKGLTIMRAPFSTDIP